MVKFEIADLAATYASPVPAIDQAIRAIEAQLAKPEFWVPLGESVVHLELVRDLPYMAHETRLPGTQILVNRNYKPLGDSARADEGWSNYEQHVSMHVRLSPAQIDEVSSPLKTGAFFSDRDAPWLGRGEAVAYLSRLQRLRDFVAASPCD